MAIIDRLKGRMRDRAAAKDEERKLQEYIKRIKGGDTYWTSEAQELIKKHPKYQEELDEAIEEGEEKELQEYIRGIKEGRLYYLNDARKLLKKYPKYQEELDEAIEEGEEKELQGCIRKLKGGEYLSYMDVDRDEYVCRLRASYHKNLNKAQELLNKFPKYKKELDEAMEIGEENTLQDCIYLIKEGETPLMTKAQELLNKFPKYQEELDEAMEIGEERELQILIKNIRGGVGAIVGTHVDRAIELLNKFPKYKLELDEAIKTGYAIAAGEYWR